MSSEYKTIENCCEVLEIVLKECDRAMVHFLTREGFIQKRVSEDVLNARSILTEAEKAGKLVDGIKDAVNLDESKFNVLVEHLQGSGKFYESTAERLSKERAKISGANDGRKSQDLSQRISPAVKEELPASQQSRPPTSPNSAEKNNEDTTPKLVDSVSTLLLSNNSDAICSSSKNDAKASPMPLLAPDQNTLSSATTSYHVTLAEGGKVRNYQHELAQPGIEGKNYIMVAPTGSGKTLAAALVISDHLNKHEDGHVIFVTETKILAHQQHQTLQNLIPNAKVAAYTGDRSDERIAFSIRCQNNISVCTAGKLFEEMSTQMITFDQVSLIVLDECHHTRKGHLYAKLMELYLESRDDPKRICKMPQIIGLTASPGGGDNPYLVESTTIDHLLHLAARMDATSGYKTVTDNLEELQEHSNTSEFSVEDLHSRDIASDPFYCEIAQEMKRLEKLVPSYKSSADHPKYSQMYETSIQQLKRELELTAGPNARDDISTLGLLRCYSNALSMYMDLQEKDAVKVIMEHTGLPDDDIKCTLREKDMKKQFKVLLSKLHSIAPKENPLLKSAEKILHDAFKRSNAVRCIVFVRTKRHAHGMREWVSENQMLKGIVPEVVTGRHTGDTGEGMEKLEQKMVMEAFRNGNVNLLIATSVAEEGLDVPACNLIIRYQHVTNEIATQQTQGRARSENSRCYLISSDLQKESKEFHNQELNLLVNRILQKGCLPTDKLARVQHKIIQAKLQRIERINKQCEQHKSEDVKLYCCRCNTFACFGSDIRTYQGKQSVSTHYVVPSDSFKEKYVAKKHHKPANLVPELKMVKKNEKIYCSNCSNDWGVRCDWLSLGCKLPVIKCRQFTFDVNGKRRIFPKWKDVTFSMKPLETWDDQS